MNITELKEHLRHFFREEIGIMVFFILKEGNETTTKLADIDNEHALPELKELFLNSITNRIIQQDNLNVMNISEADDRRNVIYEYDLDEIPSELSVVSEILENQRQPLFNFNQDDLRNIKGYIILLGDTENKLLLYKRHYAISLIKRDAFLFHKAEERFVRFDKDLIRIDDNFQFFSLNGTLFIKDLDKLEKFFGFHEVIKHKATSSVDDIEASGIIENPEVLKESIDNITFARKLTKIADNSPVLGKIPVPIIIEFSKNFPSLSGKFKYTEDGNKIRLDTKVSQNLFVKLLNDNFLKSELTNMYYDSLAKDMIQ